MLAINEVLKGVWLVQWEVRRGLKLDYEKKHDTWCVSNELAIADHNYLLQFSGTQNSIKLSVAHSDTGKWASTSCPSQKLIVFITGTSAVHRLSKVIAVHCGEKVDMNESDGTWGPARWDNIYRISNTYSKAFYCGKSPIFQIIFELSPEPASRFCKLFDTKSMSDIEFIVQGTRIEAHQLIVASASPVMAALFEPGKFKEGSSKTVEIEDIDADVFDQMLCYLYTGAAPNLEEHADSLLAAAEKYQIDSLKDECEEYLSCNVTTENITECLLLAHYHCAQKLLDTSLKHLADHKEEVWSRPEWKALGQEHSDVFFMATQWMCTNENRKRKRKWHP